MTHSPIPATVPRKFLLSLDKGRGSPKIWSSITTFSVKVGVETFLKGYNLLFTLSLLTSTSVESLVTFTLLHSWENTSFSY